VLDIFHVLLYRRKHVALTASIYVALVYSNAGRQLNSRKEVILNVLLS